MRNNDHRLLSSVGLWIFALAFGWIEAAVVIYLREVSRGDVSVVPDQFLLVSVPAHLVPVEVVREACTLLLLAAVASLAGRHWRDRVGGFLLAFGIWDLAYYGVLRLVLGWPDSLANWDILFLIPLPWVAPVWAPMTVAALFVITGTYLFCTAAPSRTYTSTDIAILIVAPLLIIAAFLAEWRVVPTRGVPHRFPFWLFWSGVILGTSWFVHVERRLSLRQRARARQEG
jgi:hypothetical protein